MGNLQPQVMAKGLSPFLTLKIQPIPEQLFCMGHPRFLGATSPGGVKPDPSPSPAQPGAREGDTENNPRRGRAWTREAACPPGHQGRSPALGPGEGPGQQVRGCRPEEMPPGLGGPWTPAEAFMPVRDIEGKLKN